MPDKKITDLVDGAPLQATDEFVVARAGDNFKIDGAEVVAAVTKHDVTLAGNTAGALALISSGTMTLAGGNNITLSQAGNAVTISGAAAAGAQTAISGLANSETTYTSGTVSLSELGAITIRSTTGQQFQFSVNAQSVQPETQTFVGGISASDTLYTSGTVRFTGSQAITVRSGTGQLVVIDAPAQSVQPETQTFIGGISASDTLYTSGTVRFTGVGGGVTVSSNTGQRVDISVAAQSVQPETQTFVAGIQNSQTTYTSGTVNLSVVAGQLTIRSTTGQAFQFSASQSVQPETQTAISGLANSQTTYTSGTVSLSELGAITIRSTTGNQFQFSVNSQSVQVETQTFVGGIGNSQTTYTSGTVNLSVVAGNLTIRSTTGQAFQFSASQSVQAETQTAISGLANSQTTYTSGTVSLSELGAITIRSTTGNQFQFSVNAQTNQTGLSGVSNSQTTYTSGTFGFSELANITIRSTTGQAFQFSVPSGATATGNINAISNSNTTYTSGTIGLSELGAITIRSTTGNQFQFSVNSQTAQTQSNIQALYDGANSIQTGTVRLTDANGVTFSINAQTLSASVNQSISMFAVSNTTQSTSGTAHKSALSFGGAGIASVGVTGGSVVISVPAGGGAGDGGVFAGVSTFGNTAGSTGTVSTGNFVLVGTGPISLSQSTGAAGSAATISINAPATSSLSATGLVSISTNGSTISIGVPHLTAAYWENMPAMQAALYTHISGVSKTPFYWIENLPQGIQPANIAMRVSMVTASADLSLSIHFGVYTFVNSTSAALLGSGSNAFVVSSASSVSFSAQRNLVLTSPGTVAAISSLTAGNYLFGCMFSATATGAMNASVYAASGAAGPRIGRIMPGTNQLSTATSQGIAGLYGRGSTTVNVMPAGVVASEVVNQGIGASSPMKPYIFIRS